MELSEEVFVIKKLKVLCHMFLVILKVKKLLERFKKKSCINHIKNNLELKILKKEKRNKLLVKWKGYDSSFNNSIDKIDIE